jgi:GT2 family glycosyltransferase
MRKNNLNRVYIAVLNYNCYLDTIDCLKSLSNLVHDNFEVLLIDNKSTDHSVRFLSQFLIESEYFEVKDTINNVISYPSTKTEKIHITFFKFNTNFGYAGAYNRILKKILHKEAYVWILNPDMIVDAFSLKSLTSFHENIQTDSIIGSVTNSYHDKDKLLFFGGGKINRYLATVNMNLKFNNYDLDYINGNSLFVKVSIFKKYGLFPENYFLYWEESEWCFLLKKKGVDLLVCPDSIGYDKGATSIGRGFLAEYYYTRNGLFFVKEHFGFALTISSVLFAVFRICKRVIRLDFKRAKGVAIGLIHFSFNKDGKF